MQVIRWKPCGCVSFPSSEAAQQDLLKRGCPNHSGSTGTLIETENLTVAAAPPRKRKLRKQY